MKKIILQVLLLGFCSNFHGQQLETQTRDNAGEYGANIKSGFFQTSNPINYPPGAINWWHLLDIRHTNPANNYAMQFSGGFSDQELWFRKTDNSASRPWSKILMERPNGNVGIGTNAPDQKLVVDFNNEQKTIKFFQPGIGNTVGTLVSSLMYTWYDNHTDIGMIRGGSKNIIGLGFRFNGEEKMRLSSDGNLGIGVSNPKNKLDVNGTIHAREVKVDLNGWPDYVFKTDYKLLSLKEVEKHIKEKGHLPDMPSEKEVLENGINLGDNQRLLLQKIEELTLYSIEQNKQIKALLDRLEKLEQEGRRP